MRIHVLAWPVADLAGRDKPGRDEQAIALAMRRGLDPEGLVRFGGGSWDDSERGISSGCAAGLTDFEGYETGAWALLSTNGLRFCPGCFRQLACISNERDYRGRKMSQLKTPSGPARVIRVPLRRSAAVVARQRWPPPPCWLGQARPGRHLHARPNWRSRHPATTMGRSPLARRTLRRAISR